jgi:membrane protein DedA with SNARE-associated domain
MSMKNRRFALPVIVGMLLFLAINYLAGVGLSMLVADTTRGALALGFALPLLSLLVLAVLWLQFRRHQAHPHR